MKKLVKEQIKLVKSKNICTALHGAIENPELLFSTSNLKPANKQSYAILKDPPLFEGNQ